MKLYSDFAKYYDLVFPSRPETLHFLTSEFEGGILLDVACGSGEYALAMAEAGYTVEGMDLDPEMIRYAKEKVYNIHLNASFIESGMLEFIPRKQYDGIYCIGNSLVHLNNVVEIKQTLEMFYKGLKKGRKLVLQIINYDKIPKSEPSFLPTIVQNRVSFMRSYEPLDANRITFHTTLSTQHETFHNKAILYRLEKKELLDILEEVGFQENTVYGDYSKNSYDPNRSFHLIVVSQK